MAVSLDSYQRPPEGFSENDWKNVCKTPCNDQVVVWVSNALVEQSITITTVCQQLAFNYECPPSSGSTYNKQIYQQMLDAWRENHNRQTFFSELISPLSNLAVPGLEAESVMKIVGDLYDQGDVFVNGDAKEEVDADDNHADDNGSPTLIQRNDSCSSSGSYHVFGAIHNQVSAVVCTEPNQVGVSACEETSRIVNHNLVTGKEITSSSKKDESAPDVNTRKIREEISKLQKKFASLLQLAYDMLDNCKAKHLRVFLNQRCVDEREVIPQFSHIMLDILSQASAEEIFLHLSQAGAWNFLSYFLLAEIIEEFDLCKGSLLSKFTSFKEEVDAFKKATPLMHFLDCWSGKCNGDQVFPGHRSVIVKSIADPASFTIANACEMAELLSGQFNLKQLAFALSNGLSGSVYIMWRAPAAATRHMLEVMKNNLCSRPDLLQYGILEVAIERTIFKSRPSYESLHKLSVSNPRLFWGSIGAKELKWTRRSSEVFSMNKETGEFHWFRGARLNACENCLDVNVGVHPEKVALIWERDDEQTTKMTYKELFEATCRVANVLKMRGIQKGDVVVIYMPTMPLAVASMLACARIGAIHCVLFSDFNARVLGERLREVKAKAIITTDVRVVGGQNSSLKDKVVAALNIELGQHEVKFVLVAKRQDSSDYSEVFADLDTNFYFSLEKEMKATKLECVPEPMDGEDIFFIAYTSGTQMGTSKAVYHTHAGYLVYTKLTFKFMFNLGPDDIMGCVSDLGWIAAHSYVVYGPLSNGATTLLFESTATYPNTNRYWRIIDDLKLTHFYTVPSVLKELKHSTPRGIEGYNLKSLKVIASGGEPMPSDVQQWYSSTVGKENCLFLDTWGQTELGGTGILRWDAPQDKRRTDFPASKSFALYGVDLDMTDCPAHQLKEQTLELYLKQPIPSMGKYVQVNGQEKETYETSHYNKEKGCFLTNDLILVDKNATLIRVTGRKDRSIFIQGVWLVIPELENCLRASHAGTKIIDAQIVSYEKEDEQSNPRLCAILKTLCDIKENTKGLWAFYAISRMAFDVAQIVTASFSEKVEYLVYFLHMSSSERTQRCLRTISGKACSSVLRKYIHQEQSSSGYSSARQCNDIDENVLLQFCPS